MITEYTYAPNRFQHAAAVCPLNEPLQNYGPQKTGILVAFYTGKTECHETQHVELAFNGQIFEELEPLTGNPVLFQIKPNEAVLVYSKFEEFPANRVRWWQHCSLWVRKIYTASDGMPIVGDPKQIFVTQDDALVGQGFLTRCHPVEAVLPGETEAKWCLPIYHERDPSFHGGLLVSSDGLEWNTHSFIGHDSTDRNERPIRCIQPTVWVDETNKLHALLRNFNRPSSQPRRAYHSVLAPNGKWTPIRESLLYNANNSLVTLNHGKRTFVLWNHDPQGRNNLCLGQMDKSGLNISNFGGNILRVAGYGHYPAMCIKDNELHVVFTTQSSFAEAFHSKSCIKHRVFSLESIENFLKARGF